MTADPTTATREQARAEATALLAAPPWDEVASRALVLLVRPPVAAWAESGIRRTLWLVIDSSEARALPQTLREALLTAGVVRGEAGEYDFVAFTAEAVARALEGVARTSLELRWTVRHAEPLHDPLRRADQLSAAAARLPQDGLERVVRPLYVQAAASLAALAHVPLDRPGGTTVLAGEAASAVTRLACAIEDGTHPPAEWLMLAARETRLGKRIGPWLDDIGAAGAGDPRATRWILESGAGVLREAQAALQAEYAGRDWLRDPETYALRPLR